MTKAISMAIELDQDIMVTNMCLKFGEDWWQFTPYQYLPFVQSCQTYYLKGPRVSMVTVPMTISVYRPTREHYSLQL